jgi:isopentenyl diphosphate isomerase/L-lactate dehydrogenase-like FMN-dependent dehydrogenase
MLFSVISHGILRDIPGLGNNFSAVFLENAPEKRHTMAQRNGSTFYTAKFSRRELMQPRREVASRKVLNGKVRFAIIFSFVNLQISSKNNIETLIKQRSYRMAKAGGLRMSDIFTISGTQISDILCQKQDVGAFSGNVQDDGLPADHIFAGCADLLGRHIAGRFIQPEKRHWPTGLYES